MIRRPRLDLVSLFAISIFLHGASASAQSSANGTADVQPQQFPGKWILLTSPVTLFDSPGGTSTEVDLSAKALDLVLVLGRIKEPNGETIWMKVQRDDQEGWVPEALLAPQPVVVSPEALRSIGSEIVNRYNGIAEDYIPPDLQSISNPYSAEVNYRLRREAAEAYEQLVGAAKDAGIRLYVVSAYRSYEKQRLNYLNKLARSDWNQKTVAKPGHSEHQLGTVVDLTDGELSTMLKESFGDGKAGKWLAEHAPEFGFAISYTRANSKATGYAPEPWHYRYFGLEKARAIHQVAIGGR